MPRADKWAMTAEQLDELVAGCHYISCTSCEHVARFWSQRYLCPIWKCSKEHSNCPRVGNKCPDFTEKEKNER